MEEDRQITLLKAALKYIRKTDQSTTVHYDETECDGYCLEVDISNYLEYEV